MCGHVPPTTETTAKTISAMHDQLLKTYSDVRGVVPTITIKTTTKLGNFGDFKVPFGFDRSAMDTMALQHALEQLKRRQDMESVLKQHGIGTQAAWGNAHGQQPPVSWHTGGFPTMFVPGSH